MTLDAQQLDSILTAIPRGVQENDLNGVITYSNTAHHKMLGYEPGEIPGKTIFDLTYDPEEKKKLKDYLAYLVAKQPEPTPYISKSIRKDGNVITTQVDWTYKYDDENRLVGFVSIISDVAKQKTTAYEESDFSEQLRQSQKMEALGQLTGGIAHDFNNILASILGYADLTLDAVTAMGEHDLARYLSEVIDSGERARDLIAQMLAFARAEPSEATTLTPAPLLKEAVKILQSAIPSSIKITANINENTSKINIEPSQLHQAVLNICINARDAIEEIGNIQINLDDASFSELSCTSCKNNFGGDFVVIRITDDGCGIEPAILNKMFDPFFTTKKDKNNTGMGLPVVHSITHENNGHITVESQPGYGTSICLFFPAATPQPKDSRQSSTTQTPDFKEIEANILVIDDEESIARLQGELLNSKGLANDIYSDPVEAMKAFSAHPDYYDLIITDQTMPFLTGIELSKQALQIKPDIPIILCSGQEKNSHKADAEEIGVAGCLTKPVQKNELLNLIKELLEHK